MSLVSHLNYIKLNYKIFMYSTFYSVLYYQVLYYFSYISIIHIQPYYFIDETFHIPQTIRYWNCMEFYAHNTWHKNNLLLSIARNSQK